jgi:hypothetical protein
LGAQDAGPGASYQVGIGKDAAFGLLDYMVFMVEDAHTLVVYWPP